ncbi:MAG: hypothetical protein OEZ09_01690 [Betaproteobacteria bacterium]|nr:hypothetical protein [Betaproteobacteria bacterium]MDH4323076.1 hypothetical protein [Betaproteobacteria bacterium]MDH5577145.1 hypothetical protein [Betaproteobacteria bacterium]
METRLADAVVNDSARRGPLPAFTLCALVFLPVGPLIVLGAGFLLAFSALILAGAYIGATLRRRFGAREPSA